MSILLLESELLVPVVELVIGLSGFNQFFLEVVELAIELVILVGEVSVLVCLLPHLILQRLDLPDVCLYLLLGLPPHPVNLLLSLDLELVHLEVLLVLEPEESLLLEAQLLDELCLQ